ncbi:hypothetical protein DL237_17010 [Pseudooceanicola sediminis]|uniref:HTH luxR-type domain-containing protein n=1 Tax=Pseudooceanicola sediminis TaxID=2211117 RepID=A0A399IX77_9RHOB|nr:LuxR family transcriptional regulator [Pseudooceanicola sediminis]KAA2312572.1 hypothetical protein E0K93_17255 [Puniceibacterium sp. HSS470]RII37580.1 hypothetical protein DL237_17010 [Pseudooceanicola sediminis]|tara:strand:+ start:3836 stop:4591 length:756 start_codon:yes stop_codon:yes gene_type:complete
MNQLANFHTDISDRFAAVRSVEESFAVLAEVVRPYGYTRFHYTQAYLKKDGQILDTATFSGMGAEYRKSVQAEAHKMEDPFVTHCRSSGRPKLWSELPLDYYSPDMTEKHRYKIRHISDHGLRAGVTVRLRRVPYGDGIFSAGMSLVQDPTDSGEEHDRAFLAQQSTIRSICEHLMTSLSFGELSRHHYKLSDREYDVLSLLAEGLQVQQIADHLTLADRTAAHHLSAMRSKLGARSNAQAVAIAIKMQVL